jgi:hypothetical protein
MAHFLYFWKLEQVEATQQDLEESISGLRHTAGAQLKRVSPDDHLWIITVDKGRLLVVAHIHVDKILNTPEAEAYLGRSNLYRSEYHAVTRRDEVEPFKILDVHETASELRFNSLTGKDRLKIGDDGCIKAQQLQTMRELAPKSAELFKKIWYYDEDQEEEGEEDILPKIKEQFADLEHRLEVEAASVGFATAQLERDGWQVESVEAQKIGYDLHCTKGERSLHVEVKGTSGEDQSFIITVNELTQAKSDSAFILFLVTKALASNPRLHRFGGQELIASFSFEPLQYRANRKT